MIIRILFILGFGFLTLGGWIYYEQERPQPLCTIDQPERRMEAKAGDEKEIVFTLHNPSRKVVKVLGLTGNCGVHGCMTARNEIPAEVPPQSSYEIFCKLTIIEPGEYSGHVNCYIADPHLREIVLKVSGIAK